MDTVSELPTTVAGRYRIIRELGRGGMGAVYLVEHIHTGERLALKVLLANAGADATTVERFKREARAPAKIRSEHVVRVTDADVAAELGGAPFLVMEALDGFDLDKMVEKNGPLAPAQVIWALRQVATALDKAHALGIVHRDLKPENLFWHHREEGGPIIKILDFGISKSTGPEMKAAGLTSTGAVMGTPLYMAPEQARGQVAAIGPQTDIWAIGLITVHLLTGQMYWLAETMAELLIKIVVDPMPPLSQRFPQLGAALDAWFARSCDRDPTRRFGSVGEQVAALAQALGVEYALPQQQNTMPQAFGTSQNVAMGASAGSSAFSASASGAVPAVTAGTSAANNFPAMSHTANAMARSTPEGAIAVPKKSNAGLIVGLAAALVLVIGSAAAWKFMSAGSGAPEAAAAASESPAKVASPTPPQSASAVPPPSAPVVATASAAVEPQPNPVAPTPPPADGDKVARPVTQAPRPRLQPRPQAQPTSSPASPSTARQVSKAPPPAPTRFAPVAP